MWRSSWQGCDRGIPRAVHTGLIGSPTRTGCGTGPEHFKKIVSISTNIKRVNRIRLQHDQGFQSEGEIETTGLRIRVPDDIAVAATTLVDTGVDSGIDQHPEEIGRVGILLLNSIINDMAIGIPSISRPILVEGSWIDGSCAPPR